MKRIYNPGRLKLNRREQELLTAEIINRLSTSDLITILFR